MVLLVHSGHSSICEEVNREAPTPRVVAQSWPGLLPYASSTNRSHCLRSMQPTRRDPTGVAWLLARRVCAQLSDRVGSGAAAGVPSPLNAGLAEPLPVFWLWMRQHNLTAIPTNRAHQHHHDRGRTGSSLFSTAVGRWSLGGGT